CPFEYAHGAVPEKQTAKGRKASGAIFEFLREKRLVDQGGGCRFYTAKEWRDRGESYGRDALLIETHDGVDHAAAVNFDYEAYALMEELRDKLDTVGVWVEQCTSWYSAVYAR